MKIKLTRREAIQSLTAGLAIAALPRSGRAASGAETPATGAGGFRHSVCKWCYRDIPLAELAAAVKEFGIDSVELLNPEEWPVVQKLGLTCAMANGTTTITKGFNRREHHAAYVESMLVRIKECAAGQLLPPNKIIYRDAFDGLLADVVYEWRKDRFAQFVVLRGQLRLPEEWDPAQVRLEVVTEFWTDVIPSLERQTLVELAVHHEHVAELPHRGANPRLGRVRRDWLR